MEEMVSKNKVQLYFDYFKKHNPLFEDEILDMERIDNWIEELKSTQEHDNHDNNIEPMVEQIDEGTSNDDNIDTYIKIDRHTDRQAAEWHTCKNYYILTNRQTDRQTDRGT